MAMRAAEQAQALAPPKPKKTVREMTDTELMDELNTGSVPAAARAEMEYRGMKVPSYGSAQKPTATPAKTKTPTAEDEGRGTLLHTKVGEVTGTYLEPATAKKDIMDVSGFVAPTAKAAILNKAKATSVASTSVQLKRVLDQTGGKREALIDARDRYRKLGMAALSNEIDGYLSAMK